MSLAVICFISQNYDFIYNNVVFVSVGKPVLSQSLNFRNNIKICSMKNSNNQKSSKTSFTYPRDNQGKGNESIEANNKHNTRPKENWSKEIAKNLKSKGKKK